MPSNKAEVLKSPAAEDDLLDILMEMALFNVRAANNLHQELDHRINQLSMFPELAPLRPEIGEEIRALPCGNYLILYRARPGRVEIARIVHGARDLTTLL